MSKGLTHPILTKPIHSMDVSKEFKAMAEANEFKTLEEMLKESLHDLPNKKLSGYRILKEMLDILEQHGLTAMLEDY